jgi:DNA-binding transcriptional LysR family regulator
MDNLDYRDLSAFAAVARHRNFRRAAAELHVSVSSLSQRLRDLEERLGIRLLNRTTRSVAPTEAGERLLDRITPALRELGDAVAEIGEGADEPAGRLRINAPEPAVGLVLAPMVAPFLKAYPNINLEVVVEPLLVDIVARGFDAGIRFEENLAQDMIAVSLGPPQRYVVVASPNFIAAHGSPKEPRDLLKQPGILTRFPNGVVLPWEFERNGETVKILPEGRLVALNFGLNIQAALGGVGFYSTFEGYVREHIEAGRLVSVLDEWCPEFSGPYLYYPSRRQPPPALRAFVDFVREWRKSQTK